MSESSGSSDILLPVHIDINNSDDENNILININHKIKSIVPLDDLYSEDINNIILISDKLLNNTYDIKSKIYYSQQIEYRCDDCYYGSCEHIFNMDKLNKNYCLWKEFKSIFHELLSMSESLVVYYKNIYNNETVNDKLVFCEICKEIRALFNDPLILSIISESDFYSVCNKMLEDSNDIINDVISDFNEKLIIAKRIAQITRQKSDSIYGSIFMRPYDDDEFNARKTIADTSESISNNIARVIKVYEELA